MFEITQMLTIFAMSRSFQVNLGGTNQIFAENIFFKATVKSHA
jgi:hypothetical protein